MYFSEFIYYNENVYKMYSNYIPLQMPRCHDFIFIFAPVVIFMERLDHRLPFLTGFDSDYMFKMSTFFFVLLFSKFIY